MKILLAHKFFFQQGGAEVFFFETGKVLEAHGHDVAYFSTRDERNRESPYARFFVSPPQYERGNFVRRAASLIRVVYSREAKRKFKELLDFFKPDIVHMFHIYVHLSPSILDACRESGIPVVMSCNDYKHICPNYKLFFKGSLCEDCQGKKFYHAVFNRCCQDSIAYSLASCLEAYAHRFWDSYRKNIRTFLFASEFMAQKTQQFWGADTFRWRLLRNPFNSERASVSLESDDYFLFLGRLIEEKGVKILLEAMRLLPEKKLIVIGEGPQRKELETLKKNYQLDQVHFIGSKWGHELVEFLSRARFIAVPSIWHENLPYVVLQAFAAGKPVIGSDRGGIPELVHHGEHGLIYRAEDAEALAAGIQELWDNPARTLEMGARARQFVVREFNPDVFYDGLMKVYAEVLP
ncbi:MAG: glycosyltransferase family 4 protein [Candidatus Aminicenantes bacterium]|nr:glycosyltransferase family 4 protein [Candidatus Aminicenantes bacterium]